MTREEAIDRLKEARAGHKEFLSVETLEMAIKALEQERKTGRWEKTRYRSVDQTGETYDDGDALRCSECAHCFKAELLWVKNFCPNCGAKMEAKE